MLFGGSSEPAYYLMITALASEIAPTKNKRSTALVQGFMQESLDIAPRRGIIRFDSIPEENLATNGMTTMQEIEEVERHSRKVFWAGNDRRSAGLGGVGKISDIHRLWLPSGELESSSRAGLICTNVMRC